MDKPRLLHCVRIHLVDFQGFYVILKLFFLNILSRNNKSQYRGKLNLIGRLQLSTEKNREEENQEIVFLRTERTKVIFIIISRHVSRKLLFINKIHSLGSHSENTQNA